MPPGRLDADGRAAVAGSVNLVPRRRAVRRCSTWAALGFASIASALRADAQGVRITGSTSVRYFELLPLAQDSVLATATSGSGTIRDSPLGAVSCPAVGDF